jgi:hypothetical protein
LNLLSVPENSESEEAHQVDEKPWTKANQSPPKVVLRMNAGAFGNVDIKHE